MLSSTVLLVVTFWLCAADVLCNDAASKEASSLCEARLQTVEAKLRDQEADLQSQKAELRTQKIALQTTLTKLNSILGDGNRDVMTRSDEGSPPVDVMTRSDPLEAVVMQMGQRLTETQAAVQVLQDGLRDNVHTLRNSDIQQSQDLQTALTSTYVHWGNSACGNNSNLVYSGFVGGGYYGITGAATNFLCLTSSPNTTVPHPVMANHNEASLFGGVYQTSGYYDSLGLAPVCSVCQASLPNTVMIPGTDVCTPGWRTQYIGFLMAGHYSSPAGSEFICVDRKMESRPGSVDNREGALMYFTKTRCGTLPCGPYAELSVVTCVVCSK